MPKDLSKFTERFYVCLLKDNCLKMTQHFGKGPIDLTVSTELFGDGWMMALKGKPGMFLQRSLWCCGGVSPWMLSICAMLGEE